MGVYITIVIICCAGVAVILGVDAARRWARTVETRHLVAEVRARRRPAPRPARGRAPIPARFTGPAIVGLPPASVAFTPGRATPVSTGGGS